MPPSRPHRGRRAELAVALALDGRQHRDIAEQAGIAPQTLSGILSGRIRDPRQSTRAAIAAALGRPESELFPESLTAGTVIDLAAKVRADRVAQGLSPDPTDEQLTWAQGFWADIRRRKVATT